jgi:hypothetical protein
MSRRKNAITKKKANSSRITERVVSAVSAVSADWGANGKRLLLLCCLLFPAKMQAQYLPQKMTLNHGEEVCYDVYFKWGILMSRAGEGILSFRETTFRGASASNYRLIFHTGKFFDSIYKMRDTIDCYYASDYSLLYSSKRTNEGGYYLIDELTFSYSNPQTRIHTFQYTPEKVKIDTTLTIASGYVFDMLGVVFFLRTLAWTSLKTGDVFPLSVAAGHDLVQLSFRYQGQDIVKKDNVPYPALRFSVDIHDKAFTQSKSAAELWVSDDENHIPLKLRSKLKIGYAEIHYKRN